MESIVLVKFDIEAGAEAINREGMVFTWEMPREVDGCYVEDGLFADTDNLRGTLVTMRRNAIESSHIAIA